jgi:hypothetical protein
LLAFLFSAVYYFVKGMPRKALVIMGGGWLFAALITVLESTLSFTAPSSIYWIGPGAVASSLANRDYYLKMVHDKHMWEPLGALENLAVAITFALLSFAVLFATVWWKLPGTQ